MGSNPNNNSISTSIEKQTDGRMKRGSSNAQQPCTNREETVKALESLLLSGGSSSQECDFGNPHHDVYGSGPLLISDIPRSCSVDGDADGDGVVMGIDEAGRGPVLGPMTYAAAFWHKHDQNVPDEFQDSKALSAMTRSRLFDRIQHSSNVGFVLRVLPASELSRNMLRNPNPYNLNAMSHDAAFEMIQAVLDAGVKIDTCYIDTVGVPQKYQERLERHFAASNIQFVVEKKADAKYPPCSAASVIAKVSRDTLLEHYTFHNTNTNYGSGYPSDPKCQAWMEHNCKDPVFAYPNTLVRFSWGPAKQALDTYATPVQWQEDDDDEDPDNQDDKTHQTTMNAFFLVQPKKDTTTKQTKTRVVTKKQRLNYFHKAFSSQSVTKIVNL